MSTIQIRDLPETAYEILRDRARARGQSLQVYMRDAVMDLAFTPDRVEVIMAIEASLAAHGGIDLDIETIRAGREEGLR